MFNNKIYYTVLADLERLTKGISCNYRNTVTASAYAEGIQEKLTEERLNRQLLGDVEDGFITYPEALTLKDIYTKYIANNR